MLGKKFFQYYFPTILWMGLIFYLSSLPNLRYPMEEISWEVILRKLAHFLEYVVLTFFLSRIFFLEKNWSEKKAVFLSFLFLALFALSDEWHQAQVVGRSGKIIDAVYDIFSGLVYLQFFLFWRRKSLAKLFLFFLWISGLLFLEGWMIKEARQYRQKKQSVNSAQIISEEKENETESAKEETAFLAENSNSTLPEVISKKEGASVKTPEILPEKFFLKVPFTSQAPLGVWDEYHEEACEEASLLMVDYFLQGKAFNKEKTEKELQTMIAFQIKRYGDYKDSSAEQIVQLGRDYFGLKNLKVIYDFSLEELKKQLAKGFPIIVPTAGRKLGNPNFTAPGPLYHNLVLSGYEKGVIITNDPGTRKGENYRYAEGVLYSAIHDFPGDKNKIESGRKAMIVVEEALDEIN